MEHTEIVKLVKDIASCYPAMFKVKGKDDLNQVVNAWSMGLEDADTIEVRRNLVIHLKTKKFPPTIAELVNGENRDRAIPGVRESKLQITCVEPSQNREKITKAIEVRLQNLKGDK